MRLSFERVGLASAHFAQYTQRMALASGTAQLTAQEITVIVVRGVPRGDAQDARASPLPPLCIPPP